MACSYFWYFLKKFIAVYPIISCQILDCVFAINKVNIPLTIIGIINYFLPAYILYFISKMRFLSYE